jgi:hypothetical protein
MAFRILLAAMAGGTTGMLAMALLRANGPDVGSPTCASECARCHGSGAYVDIVDATQRPRAFFCPQCSLGETYAAQAAGPVDFDIAVRRIIDQERDR